MTTTLSTETTRNLRGLMDDLLSPSEVVEWLNNASDDESLAPVERQALSELWLLAVEVMESLREWEEVRAKASAMLFAAGNLKTWTGSSQSSLAPSSTATPSRQIITA